MSVKDQMDSKHFVARAGHTGSSGRSGSSHRHWRRFPRSWSEVKSLGWKFVLAFILFYLIRDTILYILLPYLLFKGVISL